MCFLLNFNGLSLVTYFPKLMLLFLEEKVIAIDAKQICLNFLRTEHEVHRRAGILLIPGSEFLKYILSFNI